MGQKSDPSLHRCLWLEISHDDAVNLVVVAVGSSDGLMVVDEGREMPLHSLVWLLEALSSLLHGPPHRLMGCPHNRTAGGSRERAREGERAPAMELWFFII